MLPLYEKLKKYAGCDDKCNGDQEYTDVFPGKITIDGEEIVIHNQESREALQRLAGKLGKTIRIFNRDPTDKLDTHGLKVDDGKSPERDGTYGKYELIGGDSYKGDVADQIWIVYGDATFNL